MGKIKQYAEEHHDFDLYELTYPEANARYSAAIEALKQFLGNGAPGVSDEIVEAIGDALDALEDKYFSEVKACGDSYRAMIEEEETAKRAPRN